MRKKCFILSIACSLFLFGCSKKTVKNEYIKDVMLDANTNFENYVSILGGPQITTEKREIWTGFEIAPDITGKLQVSKETLNATDTNHFWDWYTEEPTMETYNIIKDYYSQIYPDNVETEPMDTNNKPYREHIFNTGIPLQKDNDAHEVIILTDHGSYVDFQLYFGNSYEQWALHKKH